LNIMAMSKESPLSIEKVKLGRPTLMMRYFQLTFSNFMYAF